MKDEEEEAPRCLDLMSMDVFYDYGPKLSVDVRDDSHSLTSWEDSRSYRRRQRRSCEM